MTAWLLPGAGVVASFALTYLFCIRPMRHGRGCHGISSGCGGRSTGEVDRAIQHARTELQLLRAREQLRQAVAPREAGRTGDG